MAMDWRMFNTSELLKTVLQTKEDTRPCRNAFLLFLLTQNLKDQPKKHLDCEKLNPNGMEKQYAMEDLCI